MKIISKYKDYYDYLQGIWGMDERLILDRTLFSTTPDYNNKYYQFPHIELIRFYICGNVVEGIYYQANIESIGRFLFGKDIEDVIGHWIYTTQSKGLSKNDPRYYHIKVLGLKWNKPFKILKKPTPFYDLDHNQEKYRKNINKAQCPNYFLNCPIIKETRPTEDEFDLSRCEKFPILKDYSMHKVYSAQNMWLMLVEWLGREKTIPNNQTNTEKIMSHGFDVKTSFRHPV